MEANLVLRVDWVEFPHLAPGRLGMTICPGRGDRDRNLEADLAQLRTLVDAGASPTAAIASVRAARGAPRARDVWAGRLVSKFAAS